MKAQQPISIAQGDALIVVDVQNDFLPGGSLAVENGDQVIPALNQYIAAFVRRGLPVFATRDWHTTNHVSFAARGGPWPPHCVAGTQGAEYAAGLELPDDAVIVSKGTSPDADAYSGFEGTDLDAQLRERGVKRVFVGGLATDYCVLNTVRDAHELGYDVILLADACRAVNVQPGDGEKAETEMRELGATPVTTVSLAA